MKTQDQYSAKGILRWVHLTFSITALMVALSIISLLICYYFHYEILKLFHGWFNTDEPIFVVLILLGAVIGLILAVLGRDSFWIKSLSVLASVGIVVCFSTLWIGSIHAKPGLLGSHFLRDVLIFLLIVLGASFAFAAVAATLVMVYDAKCGRHSGNDCHAPPKK
jgi:hypothetical protein